MTPEPIAVAEETIRTLLQRAYGTSAEGETPESLAVEACRLSDRAEQAVSDMPVVRLFDMILAEAVRDGATDLHLQPAESELLVRLRIDGFLHTVYRLPLDVAQPLCTRVKILAGLDISERRLPQDGKIALTFGRRPVDLRVSTLLTTHGECAVLRVLDHSRVRTSLETLGLPEEQVGQIRNLLTRPHGILLVTGPTGSGKTTTLYSCLEGMERERQSILTLEDPVEYRLDGLRQSQINEKAGLTFDVGLRSMLRQDPDVILVGEMRDAETVQTAMRAAITGHLVLSTLHTNGAIGAVTRLRDLGVENFLLAASLSAVLAQRLARRNCERCRETVPASESEKIALGLDLDAPVELSRGRGCGACHGVGYAGRFAISELLLIDGPLQEAIAAGRDESVLRELARTQGFRTLREAMQQRILQGWSTVDEMARVVA
jgi:type II secretory ATPase GspE/PulE/Tfp pilus assembly ATPase PilB-like protein